MVLVTLLTPPALVVLGALLALVVLVALLTSLAFVVLGALLALRV